MFLFIECVIRTPNGDKLVRLRNPWGQVEWEGKWCDDSIEWDLLDKDDMKFFAEDKEDGEFYMCLEDFCAFFSKVELCNLLVSYTPELHL